MVVSSPSRTPQRPRSPRSSQTTSLASAIRSPSQLPSSSFLSTSHTPHHASRTTTAPRSASQHDDRHEGQIVRYDDPCQQNLAHTPHPTRKIGHHDRYKPCAARHAHIQWIPRPHSYHSSETTTIVKRATRLCACPAERLASRDDRANHAAAHWSERGSTMLGMTAQFVDVPLEVLLGLEREIRSIVTNVIRLRWVCRASWRRMGGVDHRREDRGARVLTR